jgi:hypothetical protein
MNPTPVNDEWKLTYISLLEASRTDPLKRTDASDLKRRKLPPKVYKYRAFDRDKNGDVNPNGYSLTNLREGLNWFQPPSKFNDPFDSEIRYTEERLAGAFLKAMVFEILRNPANSGAKGFEYLHEVLNVRDTFRETYSQIPRNFRKILFERKLENSESNSHQCHKEGCEVIRAECIVRLDQFMKGFREDLLTCCFSEDPLSTLMWSHYAADHSGFCIEYNLSQMSDESEFRERIQPVIYQREMYDATASFEDYILSADGQQRGNLFLPVIHKEERWSYEKEWRLIKWQSGEGPRKRGLHEPSTRPSRLFLGAKAKPDCADLLLEIAREKKIPVSKVELVKGSFQLRAVELPT